MPYKMKNHSIQPLIILEIEIDKWILLIIITAIKPEFYNMSLNSLLNLKSGMSDFTDIPLLSSLKNVMIVFYTHYFFLYIDFTFITICFNFLIGFDDFFEKVDTAFSYFCL